MLTANRLEKIMELENSLRDQYQGQLEAKDKELEELRAQLEKLKTDMQATIDKQLASIKDLSVKATANDRVELQNRELTNRSEKQLGEISELKKRVKSVQREIVELRDENKTLTQYDPARMRKNLDANKKKLAEKTKANDLLQKSLNTHKKDNAALKAQVEELEAKLKALESAEETESSAEEQQEKEAA